MSRISIPARPQDPDARLRFVQDLTIVLGRDIENDYEAIPKRFPTGLNNPMSWTDPDDGQVKSIVWVSNFEVRRKDGQAIPDPDKTRTFAFQLTNRVGLLVCYTANGVVKLTPTPAGAAVGAAVEAALSLGVGDPPVGWAK